MFWLKSCPRCKGDLYEGFDPYGGYVACMQCGRYLTEEQEVALRHWPGNETLWNTSETATETGVGAATTADTNSLPLAA